MWKEDGKPSPIHFKELKSINNTERLLYLSLRDMYLPVLMFWAVTM